MVTALYAVGLLAGIGWLTWKYGSAIAAVNAFLCSFLAIGFTVEWLFGDGSTKNMAIWVGATAYLWGLCWLRDG